MRGGGIEATTSRGCFFINIDEGESTLDDGNESKRQEMSLI